MDNHKQLLNNLGLADLFRKPGLTAEPVCQGMFYITLAVLVLIPWGISLAQVALGFAILNYLLFCYRTKSFIRPKSFLNKPIYLFLALALLSAFIGVNLTQSLWRLTHFWSLTLYILFYAILTGKDQSPSRILRTVLHLFIISLSIKAVGSALYKLWDIYRGGIWFTGDIRESGILAIGIVLAVSLFVFNKNRNYRIFLACCLILMVADLVLNFKRGAWLGVLTSCLIIGAMRSWKVPAISLVVALLIVASYPYARARLDTLTQQHFLIDEGRTRMWTLAPTLIKLYPLGAGIGNAGIVMHRHDACTQEFWHLHNNFLNIWVEMGVQGLLAFIFWLGTWFWISWDTYHKYVKQKPDSLEAAVLLSIFSGLVGFVVNGLFEFNFGYSELFMLFCIMMGITIALRNNFIETPEMAEKEVKSSNSH